MDKYEYEIIETNKQIRILQQQQAKALKKKHNNKETDRNMNELIRLHLRLSDLIEKRIEL